MKRYSRNLLVAFVVTAAAVMPVLFWLRDAGFLLLPEDAEDSYLVAISVYDGFALAGLLVMLRFLGRDTAPLRRVGGLLVVLVACTVARLFLDDAHPDPLFVVGSFLWETARALCVGFAVAFVAHAMMVRFLPSTLLRVRDVTPILTEGDEEGRAVRRVKHARRTRWLFDLGSREYLDTTRVRLVTQDLDAFSWREWGRVALWASVGLLALSIYAEAYPRAEHAFDVLWDAVITAHLLSIVPILVLPMLPITALGPRIPAGRGEYCLATGYSVQLTRWLKIAFFPIIAVGLLFRTLSWENAIDLTQAVLVTVPTALITCMVYITWFRKRTVAEVHRGIAAREEVEERLFGPDPWRETSLLEGVEVVEADLYLE